MGIDMDGPDALWTEFSAGNEGGGILSSSSLPSSVSSWCSPRVTVGTATPIWVSLGTTFGVDCVEEAGLVEVSTGGCSGDGSRGMSGWILLLLSGAASRGLWLGKRCVYSHSNHVDGGWWYMSTERPMVTIETAMSMLCVVWWCTGYIKQKAAEARSMSASPPGQGKPCT